MKTLKEIKEYLKRLEAEAEIEIITSARGNIYKVIKVEKKLLDKIKKFKSVKVYYHEVNNRDLYPILWYDKYKYQGNKHEIILVVG